MCSALLQSHLLFRFSWDLHESARYSIPGALGPQTHAHFVTSSDSAIGRERINCLSDVPFAAVSAVVFGKRSIDDSVAMVN